MSEKTIGIIIGSVIGVVATIALFCLIVCIGSAVNGLTFGAQVSNWFGASSEVAINEIITLAFNNKLAI